MDGDADGTADGFIEGYTDGIVVGMIEGTSDGSNEGANDGIIDGTIDGDNDKRKYESSKFILLDEKCEYTVGDIDVITAVVGLLQIELVDIVIEKVGYTDELDGVEGSKVGRRVGGVDIEKLV